MLTGCQRTPPVLGCHMFEIGAILCVIAWCVNNMLLCEKVHINIGLYDV